MKHGVAVIVGATGLIGQRLAHHLQGTGAWDLIGLCRNATRPSPIPLLSVDLVDAASCRQAVAGLDTVTHVFYTARFDHPEGVHESVETNATMLRNVVDAIDAASPRLAHVHAVGANHQRHVDTVVDDQRNAVLAAHLRGGAQGGGWGVGGLAGWWAGGAMRWHLGSMLADGDEADEGSRMVTRPMRGRGW